MLQWHFSWQVQFLVMLECHFWWRRGFWLDVFLKPKLDLEKMWCFEAVDYFIFSGSVVVKAGSVFVGMWKKSLWLVLSVK